MSRFWRRRPAAPGSAGASPAAPAPERGSRWKAPACVRGALVLLGLLGALLAPGARLANPLSVSSASAETAAPAGAPAPGTSTTPGSTTAGSSTGTNTATTPTTPATPATTPTTPTTPAQPTRLLALPDRDIANGTHPLLVTLSAPPAPGSPSPALSPAVAGDWVVSGSSWRFTPASTLQPCSSYSLTVWSHTQAQGATVLGRRRTISLNVACPPLIGLQEALARLGYIGAAFHPAYTVKMPRGAESRHEAAVRAYHAPRGALVPDPSGAPRVQQGQLDAVTRGALVVYQTDHDLEVTGEPNKETWNSLLSSLAANRRDPAPYTWVDVSESLPETLYLHRGNHLALTTPVNTGVPGAETERGTFPIYSRFVSTTMSGTDPDGTKYVAPDVPWVNYFNGGDAVHGYPRESYGFPQSNGCVELPIEAAHTAFGMLALGDIVVVE